jgi:hypothetical protein
MSNTPERAAERLRDIWREVPNLDPKHLKAIDTAIALLAVSSGGAGTVPASWDVETRAESFIGGAGEAQPNATLPQIGGSADVPVRCPSCGVRVGFAPSPFQPSPEPRAEPPVGEVTFAEALRLLFEGAFNGGASLQARHLSERGDSHGFRAYRDAITAECLEAALRRVSASPANTERRYTQAELNEAVLIACERTQQYAEAGMFATASAQQRPTREQIAAMRKSRDGVASRVVRCEIDAWNKALDAVLTLYDAHTQDAQTGKP